MTQPMAGFVVNHHITVVTQRSTGRIPGIGGVCPTIIVYIGGITDSTAPIGGAGRGNTGQQRCLNQDDVQGATTGDLLEIDANSRPATRIIESLSNIGRELIKVGINSTLLADGVIERDVGVPFRLGNGRCVPCEAAKRRLREQARANGISERVLARSGIIEGEEQRKGQNYGPCYPQNSLFRTHSL